MVLWRRWRWRLRVREKLGVNWTWRRLMHPSITVLLTRKSVRHRRRRRGGGGRRESCCGRRGARKRLNWFGRYVIYIMRFCRKGDVESGHGCWRVIVRWDGDQVERDGGPDRISGRDDISYTCLSRLLGYHPTVYEPNWQRSLLIA